MELTNMPVDQCKALLHAGIAGRIAIYTPDGPRVFPVNYSMVEDSVVIRTSPTGMLAEYAPGTVVAFEVDQFHYDGQIGWSVLMRGKAHHVTSLTELERVEAMWLPRPWADGDRTFFLRVECREISGRKLGGGWDIEPLLPVHRMPTWNQLHTPN